MEHRRRVSNYEISQDAITKAGCGFCMIRMWVSHPIEQPEEPPSIGFTATRMSAGMA